MLVYYEELLNEDEFNYIVQNALYNADTQNTLASNSYIYLPEGPSAFGSIGAIELKAAWKVLTPAELNAKPVRFHTADRKSTRLNSSHRCISYAVFCLKKKKK